jgi:hypothetical protein
MVATPKVLGSYRPVSDDDALIAYMKLPLAANQQIGKGQLTTFSAVTALLSLADSATPNQIAGGHGDYSELSDKATVDGAAIARVSQKFSNGLGNSAADGDTLANTDFCGVAWIADENSIGKLSHTGADGTLVNRSMAGLFFGLYSIDGRPILWHGPVPWLLARATHCADNKCAGAKTIALATSTSIAETVIPRVGGKLHGHISQIRLIADGAIATDETNYWTFDVYKRSATTPGTAIKIAEIKTKTTGGVAVVAWTALDVTIVGTSAQLDLLETDIVTVAAAANGTGNVTTTVNASFEVLMKVG